LGIREITEISNGHDRGLSQTETRRPDHEAEANFDLADRPESNSGASSGESSQAKTSRPDYEIVDTVEASYDLADQLQRLCPRLCRPTGRHWRPRGGRKARQRMAIREGARNSKQMLVTLMLLDFLNLIALYF
jgi:hypothetical protein